MDQPHVVALSGSLRDRSNTRVALDHALAAADGRGATTDCIDLRNLELPVFDADDREVGDAAELLERVDRADSLLLGTPVYHGSYSGVLKNAVDYCGFDEFRDTTCGLVAVAGGGLPGGTFAHLRAVCSTLNAWVLPRTVAIRRAKSRIDHDVGEVTDRDIADRLAQLGENAVRYAGIESPER
jgi:NAD(P)H-dependent FMN reductase